MAGTVPAPQRKPTVLAVADYFVPGFRGGGVITAVANVTQQLQSRFSFDILTSDRDLDATEPYPNIERAAWNTTPFGNVYYTTPAQRHPVALRNVLRDVSFDLLYLNSFFSPLTFYLLLLRRLGFLPRTPVVLAPRGELASSALAVRRRKKMIYERVTRHLALDDIVWQASSVHEAEDIVAFFDRHGGRAVRCVVTGEVPAPVVTLPEDSRLPKRAGHVRAVFLGRVHRIKNLDVAINLLARAGGDVELTIVGQIEDPDYWKECQALIAALPKGKTVRWAGVFPREQVAAMLMESDLMILPTRGENFGHAILEAFAAGCPVLISDQTPWRDLASHGIGWDLPLDDLDAADTALARMITMGPDEHGAMRERAKAFARVAVPDAVRLQDELFRLALK